MNTYTIKEVAEKLNIPASTIRYYDKEGLLPFVGRSAAGYRTFSDADLMMFRIIECLKKTGMSLKEIRQYAEWAQMGDASLEQRYRMFLERRKAVEAQMAELQEMLNLIDYKCQYYEKAIAAGTEEVNWKKDETRKGEGT